MFQTPLTRLVEQSIQIGYLKILLHSISNKKSPFHFTIPTNSLNIHPICLNLKQITSNFTDKFCTPQTARISSDNYFSSKMSLNLKPVHLQPWIITKSTQVFPPKAPSLQVPHNNKKTNSIMHLCRKNFPKINQSRKKH